MALSSWIIIANEAKSSAWEEGGRRELLKLLIDSINWMNVIHFVDGCVRKKENCVVLYSFSDDHWLEIKMIYQTFTFTTLFSLFEHFKRGCEICIDFVPIEISFVSDPEFCMIRKKYPSICGNLPEKGKKTHEILDVFQLMEKSIFCSKIDAWKSCQITKRQKYA